MKSAGSCWSRYLSDWSNDSTGGHGTVGGWEGQGPGRAQVGDPSSRALPPASDFSFGFLSRGAGWGHQRQHRPFENRPGGDAPSGSSVRRLMAAART
jgi:hypothetical protein